MIKKAMAVLAAGAMLAASAQAACWPAETAAAAGVRELQSKLMVAALRCQVSGFPLMAEYNAFVAANRTAIGRINDLLKLHFIRAHGPVQGQRAYDSFTTAMANGYGAAASGAEQCANAANLAREGAMLENSLDGLMLLIAREAVAARLPEGVCAAPQPVTIAAVGAATLVAQR
jgi:hypothetical protein